MHHVTQAVASAGATMAAASTKTGTGHDMVRTAELVELAACLRLLNVKVVHNFTPVRAWLAFTCEIEYRAQLGLRKACLMSVPNRKGC